MRAKVAYWDVVCVSLEEEAKRMSIALGIPDVVGVIVIFCITVAVGLFLSVVFQVPRCCGTVVRL